MDENSTTSEAPAAAAATDAIDDLSWDDWSAAEVCAIENGPDCEACEG